MLTAFISLGLLYGVLISLLALFQRKLIYHPNKAINTPSVYGLLGFHDICVQAEDQYMLQLWHHPAEPGQNTLIYFHGNASHLGDRAGRLDAFSNAGLGVLALSYPGYGKSTGKPSENAIYNAARAAIYYATHTLMIPPDKLVYYGESLGTGVAIQMATEHKPHALVLEAPYTSVAKRAAEIYYYVPVKLLLRDKYNSLEKISRVQCPLLIFHGELDPTIPIIHGKTLLAAANEPKKGVFFERVAHTDFDSSLLAKHVLEFISQ